ncbi:MAG TPA: FtsW/RodA/SpoVE family cell cycle protein [Bacteroidia bacterium]
MNVLRSIKGDKVIWMIVLLFSLVSVIEVYSAVAQIASRFKGGNTGYYLVKHSLIICLGLGLMFMVHRMRYTLFSRLSQIALWVSAPLLLYTLLKGHSAGGAARWLEIPGTGLTFQTSDFAKLALIVYLARVLSIKQGQFNDFKTVFIHLLIPIGVICGLILPANFSTAALLGFTCFLLMYIGKVPLKYLLMVLGGGVLALSMLVLVVLKFPDAFGRGGTWKHRIESFTSGDSDENFQAEQAKIAIGTSGLFWGKGPGNSTMRGFIPEASSDMIFPIIVEELGLLIGGFVVLLYVIFLFRGIRIAQRSTKLFGTLSAFGLCFSLVLQAMINMAVAVGLLPVTGQPLPMVSMGGTSIWFTSITIGVILSVSREMDKQEPPAGEEEEEGESRAAA